MFTSLTIVALVSSPVSDLVSIRSLFNSSLGCFHRIQSFLVLPEIQRLEANLLQTTNAKDVNIVSNKTGGGNGKRSHELEDLSQRPASLDTREPQAVVKITNATFENSDGTQVLKGIDLDIRQSSIHAIIGPVGSGKTSLLLAILGELGLRQGSSWVQPGAMAFCAQTPWLKNSSIRSNVVGDADFDANWYHRIICACGLNRDFVSTLDWDTTSIGSQALRLSGGQRQRVVRLYQCCDSYFPLQSMSLLGDHRVDSSS